MCAVTKLVARSGASKSIQSLPSPPYKRRYAMVGSIWAKDQGERPGKVLHVFVGKNKELKTGLRSQI